MQGIAVLPVDYFPNSTNPKNPILAEAVQKWCEGQFGHRLGLHAMGKAWAAVRQTDEGYEVLGLTAIALAVDCPVFHVEPATDEVGGPTRETARAVRDALMQRAANCIQDSHGAGTDVLVYVSPEQERFWRGYLRLIGAQPSGRFILKV